MVSISASVISPVGLFSASLTTASKFASGKLTVIADTVCADDNSTSDNKTSLNLSSNQISDLNGLQNLTNLTSLYADKNQFADITPLTDLTKLQFLGIRNNQISNLAPLSNLISLRQLSLSNNLISDISPLENLAAVYDLGLRNNQISNISPLSNLTNLDQLRLQNNRISDLTSLQNLSKLRVLWLYDNQISDITPLVLNSGLGSGDQIYLSNNYLDISPGSQNMTDIDALIARGAIVFYTPQKALSVSAEFSFFPDSQNEGADVTFTDLSTPSTGPIVSWAWDFGDTNSSTIQNPSHTYADNGTYAVTLTVTAEDGLKDSISHDVTINNVAPSVSIDSIDQPNPYFILPGQTLTFEGSFIDPGWPDTHSASWDFGDNANEAASLIEENEKPDSTGTTTATHSYSNPGTYTVTLTVADDDLASTSVTKTVVVSSAEESMNALNSYIQSLPDGAFSKNANKQRSNLASKFDEIMEKIGIGDYQGAINKLNNNIKKFADGSLGGNPKNDWIIEPEGQQEIGDMVDSITAYLETLM